MYEVGEALAHGKGAPLMHLIGVQNPGTGHGVCSLAREGGNDTLTDGQKLVAVSPQP